MAQRTPMIERGGRQGMTGIITDEQAAVLSDLVYAVSTEGDNAGNYIFDDASVDQTTGDSLRSYIYETNAYGQEVFRQGIPEYLKKQMTAMPYRYNEVLNRFQLRATSNTIDQGENRGLVVGATMVLLLA
jgi:hypothetical protein